MLFPATASDEKLISKALGGSQNSWVNIVKRHEGLVYNYCLRMTGSRSDALDLMQEVFLSVYRHLPSYRGQGQFKAWMMRIAANKTIDFLRSRARTPQFGGGEEGLDQHEAPAAHNPDTLYEQADHNREILRMLQILPPEQRLVVELKFFSHCTFEEISYRTGVPMNTVKSRLYAALEKLRDQLEEQHVM